MDRPGVGYDRDRRYLNITVSSEILPLDICDFDSMLDAIRSYDESGGLYPVFDMYKDQFLNGSLFYNSSQRIYTNLYLDLYYGTKSRKKKKGIQEWFDSATPILKEYSHLIGSCECYVYNSRMLQMDLELIDHLILELH